MSIRLLNGTYQNTLVRRCFKTVTLYRLDFYIAMKWYYSEISNIMNLKPIYVNLVALRLTQVRTSAIIAVRTGVKVWQNFATGRSGEMRYTEKDDIGCYSCYGSDAINENGFYYKRRAEAEAKGEQK